VVEEAGVPGENHWPVVKSLNVYYITTYITDKLIAPLVYSNSHKNWSLPISMVSDYAGIYLNIGNICNFVLFCRMLAWKGTLQTHGEVLAPGTQDTGRKHKNTTQHKN
jgi:hypothetical protein